MSEPTDYAGNSKKDKGEVPAPDTKGLTQVTSGKVVERKKGVGERLKEAFIVADWKTTSHYVFWGVLIPAAKNMLWDIYLKGGYRTLYGQDSPGVPPTGLPGQHGQQTHITYNTQVKRNVPWATPQRPMDPRFLQPGVVTAAPTPSYDYILPTPAEAQRVLTMLSDTVDTYGVATVADLHTLLGIQSPHTDHKWGWENLAAAKAYQTKEGWALDLPAPIPV